MKICKRLLSLVLCAALLLCALPMNALAANSDTAASQSTASNFPNVLAETKKGVVSIYGVGTDGYFLSSWSGTGFAVGEPGKDSDVFLTNWHVVTASGDFPMEDVRIWIMQENCAIDEKTLEPDPAKSITCEVLKTTTGYPDYAIIRATEPVSGYKPLPLLSSEAIPDGETVYALGYPGVVGDASVSHYGISDITSTNGIISQHMQYAYADNTWVLMHTAQISGGNSGGPLITEEGAVVGLNTYGFGENEANMNRYCAVYIDYAIEGLDELGLPYETFGAEASEDPAEETKDGEEETTDETTDEDEDSEEDKSWFDEIRDKLEDEEERKEVLPWIIIGAVVIVAAIAAVVVLVQLKKKREAEERERQRRQMEAERRRQEEEARRRQEEEARRRQEEAQRRAQEVKARLQLNGGTIYPVRATGCIIGRERDCGILLPEGTSGVSRHHCKLEFRGDTLVLPDLNSTYGTYIHGKRVPANTPIALKPGSSFCLGSESCRFTVC